MAVPFIPNVVSIGEPGSGKSVAAASDAVNHRGGAVVFDPHRDSLAKMVLEHSEGQKVLYDRLSDLEHTIGYGLLRPSMKGDAMKRAQENLTRARLFVQVMMRRRGGDAATSPLLEEWVMAVLLLFLNQKSQKMVRYVPFALLPESDEFRHLVNDCTLHELREKFRQLQGLKPRTLRTEVGSASRLINAVFLSPAFIARCEAGSDLPAFLQAGGKLLVERGDESEDVNRTITGGITFLVVNHVETRPQPWPPIRMYFDEGPNARTVGDFEQQKAGETRKYGLSWYFICQHPNFPDPQAIFANCQKKLVFRSTYEIARKMAPMFVAGCDGGDESRASRIDAVVSEIVNFRPGQQWTVDRDGARKETVPMLKSDWPDWPGLQSDILEKTLCRIYRRPEYQRGVPSCSTSPSATPSPPPSSPSFSPAERWKRSSKKPPASS